NTNLISSGVADGGAAAAAAHAVREGRERGEKHPERMGGFSQKERVEWRNLSGFSSMCCEVKWYASSQVSGSGQTQTDVMSQPLTPQKKTGRRKVDLNLTGSSSSPARNSRLENLEEKVPLGFREALGKGCIETVPHRCCCPPTEASRICGSLVDESVQGSSDSFLVQPTAPYVLNREATQQMSAFSSRASNGATVHWSFTASEMTGVTDHLSLKGNWISSYQSITPTLKYSFQGCLSP
ncbi:unnamed protein product, partial [Cyprideis torosa]